MFVPEAYTEPLSSLTSSAAHGGSASRRRGKDNPKEVEQEGRQERKGDGQRERARSARARVNKGGERGWPAGRLGSVQFVPACRKFTVNYCVAISRREPGSPTIWPTSMFLLADSERRARTRPRRLPRGRVRAALPAAGLRTCT